MSSRSAYSVASLAQKWGVSRGYVYKLVRAGQLRPFTPPPLIRITTAEVERFEAGQAGTDRDLAEDQVLEF
jgi:hypothetical protein